MDTPFKNRCARRSCCLILDHVTNAIWYSVLIVLVNLHLGCYRQSSPNVALTCAAAADDVEGMKRALASGADINSAPFGSGGRTALMQAAFFGRVKAINFLIEKGAELNRQDWGGRTALHYTAELYPESTMALIRSGADMNIKDKSGLTPLMQETNPNIRRLMKDFGAR